MAIRGAPRTAPGSWRRRGGLVALDLGLVQLESCVWSDGRKPSGRSTIITSSRKPKIPKLIDVTSKSSPILSG